jgi:hypothetical protein
MMAKDWQTTASTLFERQSIVVHDMYVSYMSVLALILDLDGQPLTRLNVWL